MATEVISETESGLPYGGITGSLGIDRDKLLSILTRVIKSLEFKIEKGRIRDLRNEKLRLEQLRVLFYGCSVANSVLKDKNAEEIDKRLTELEYAIKKH